MQRCGWLVWVAGLPVLYVLSSGPALLLERTPIWPAMDLIYWPLKKAASATPAHKLLLPYWDIWHDREMNPLILG